MPDTIAYDPNQKATLKFKEGERDYEIETCQESLRQMHESTMQYQSTREFSATRDGVTSTTQTGQSSASGAGAGPGTGGGAPADAVTPSIDAGEVGLPTGLDDEIRDAIQDALGKAREELQKVLADGLQITIERTPGGGLDVKAQSLKLSGAPTGAEADDLQSQVRLLPDADAEVCTESAVVEPGATEPRRVIAVGVAHPPTQADGSTSTFIPSAKADAESIGLIAVSTAVAINAPLISIQVTA